MYIIFSNEILETTKDLEVAASRSFYFFHYVIYIIR